MYFADPIGNCLLTTKSYFKFTERLLKIAEDICNGKLVYILEGGYSILGLPVCIYTIIQSLLNEKYEPPSFEYLDFTYNSKKDEITKIKSTLINLLADYWDSFE